MRPVKRECRSRRGRRVDDHRRAERGGVADVVGARQGEQVTAGRRGRSGSGLPIRIDADPKLPHTPFADRSRLQCEDARGEPRGRRRLRLGVVGARRDREAAGRAEARRAAGGREDAVHLQNAARGWRSTSFVNVSVVGRVLPAVSAAVTVSVGWLDDPSVQVNVFESNGPPAGVESVLGVCVQPVDVPPSAAVVLDAGAAPPTCADRVADREAAARAAARALVEDGAERACEVRAAARLGDQRERVRRRVGRSCRPAR